MRGATEEVGASATRAGAAGCFAVVKDQDRAAEESSTAEKSWREVTKLHFSAPPSPAFTRHQLFSARIHIGLWRPAASLEVLSEISNVH